MSNIHWTDAEFISLAQALRAQFPERAAAQAATPLQFVFTTHEVGTVVRANFPRERQRAVTKGMARKLAAKLIEACGGSLAPVRKRAASLNGHVRWTPDEWRVFALALVTMFPQFDLLNSPDLIQLRLSHLNKACAVMPPGRRRTFNALGGPIKYLTEVFTAARQSGDPLYLERPAAPAQAVVTASKPAAQARPAPAPRDVPKLHQVGAPCKVYWSRTEWVKVAAELHRQYPHAKYPERGQLGALTSADVCGAQHVLPEDRRRKNLKLVAMSALKNPLLEAFKTVRAMLAEDAALKQAQAQQEHAALLARAAELAAVPNQWEVVFKPLVELLVREVGAQLLPALIEGLANAAPPRPTPPAHLTLAPALAKPAGKTMRIGVVGNRSSYADDLERQFPSVDFDFIENTKEIDSVRNCDKVIVLIKFVSHKLCNRVRSAVGERYVPVNGSVSDMIRVIGSWLAEKAKGAAVSVAA